MISYSLESYKDKPKTHWLYVLPVGALWFVIYYFVFKTYILKFNVPTPGRGEDEVAPEAAITTKDSLKDDSVKIIEYLGGQENIEDVDACITRLRVSVKSQERVNKEGLKALGATDVLVVGDGIQAIYGAKAILYKNNIVDILGIDE
ncbi:glucose PTS transporter subunit EIIB [Erysipelothrix sp. Poltava]|nr:glucose PTS transporter subunit EIIB [Erysipelothrix sp. Poltava]